MLVLHKLYYFVDIHVISLGLHPLVLNDVCVVKYSHICVYYVTLIFSLILLQYHSCTSLPIFI